MHCAQFCSGPTMQIYQNSKSRMESRCQSPILSCLLRQFPFLPLKLHLVGQVLERYLTARATWALGRHCTMPTDFWRNDISGSLSPLKKDMTARRASYYEAWNAAAVYHDFGLMHKAHAPSGPSASMLWFLQVALQPSSPRTLHLRAFPSTGDKQRLTTLRHKNLQDLHTGKARYASPLHTSYRPGSGGSDIACGSHHNSFLPGKPLTRYKMPVLHDLDWTWPQQAWLSETSLQPEERKHKSGRACFEKGSQAYGSGRFVSNLSRAISKGLLDSDAPSLAQEECSCEQIAEDLCAKLAHSTRTRRLAWGRACN